MSAARGPRSPFTMPSGDLGLVAVPGPVTKIPQHGTGDRRNNRWPQRWALEILAAAGLRGCTGRHWWPSVDMFADLVHDGLATAQDERSYRYRFLGSGTGHPCPRLT